MGRIKENISLKKFNTFNVEAKTRYFVELSNKKDILNFLNSSSSKISPRLIMGEGSNLLFIDNFDGIVIKTNIKGIYIIKEDKDFYYVKAGAGENWDNFVKYCVKNNFGGLENLSLIPGTVGACPIQNIGAYGMEVKDVIEHVETINLLTGNEQIFKNIDCKFKYRDSIFKNKYLQKTIITNVVFRLTKNHKFNTDFKQLAKELKNYSEINLANIREVIINIRNNKLPDVKEYGNAGSFFKNPIVKREIALSIKKYYPGVPIFEVTNDYVKLSAAWLIEQCKWKGKKIGNVGTYRKQPLVIVNYGNATGKEILNFAQKIIKTVKQHFAITLETEVNIIQ